MGEINNLNDIQEVKEQGWTDSQIWTLVLGRSPGLSNSSMWIHVKDHLAAKTLAVINVSATWCGPCRALAPHYNQLASENAHIGFSKRKNVIQRV